MQKQPFSPHYGSGVALIVGTASTAYAIDVHNKNVVVANTGTAVFFVRVGTGTTPGVGITAVAGADFPVMPGHAVSLTKADGQDTIAAVAAAAGGTGYAISGEGFMF